TSRDPARAPKCLIGIAENRPRQSRFFFEGCSGDYGCRAASPSITVSPATPQPALERPGTQASAARARIATAKRRCPRIVSLRSVVEQSKARSSQAGQPQDNVDEWCWHADKPAD